MAALFRRVSCGSARSNARTNDPDRQKFLPSHERNTMRLLRNTCIVATGFFICWSVGAFAQAPATAPGGQGAPGGAPATPRVGFPGSATADGSRAVTDGGIKVAGWSGKIDDAETKAGMTINDAKFAAEGANFHVTTGPATTYWKNDAKATGDYTVSASFNEPKY